MPFASLGLSPELLRAVAANAYPAPTAIQAQAIPAILQDRDVWACAQTGSGKTAAFGLAVLQQLQRQPPRNGPREAPLRVRTLILVPTRELAAQVGEAIESFAVFLPRPAKVISVFGGVSINPQMMALRGGADVVVATPGRLLDLVDHNALRLAEVATLVLDEADRLLDLGFSAEACGCPGTIAAEAAEPAFFRDVPACRAGARGAVASRPGPHRCAQCCRDSAGHRAAIDSSRCSKAHAAAAQPDQQARLDPHPCVRRHALRHRTCR